MGIGRAVFVVAALGGLAACSSDAQDPTSDQTPSFGKASPTQTQAPSSSSQTNNQSSTQQGVAPTGATGVAAFPEVVYVIMNGKDGWIWFCTGALVSKSVVVTAAHCLQEDLFLDWTVVAPSLANKPRVKATSVEMYDPDFEAVDHPDIGIVRLSQPITLAQYAKLADVSSRIDAGQSTQVATIVRTAEQPEASLKQTGNMALSSTVQYGYTDGYGVPMYSHGGDSGAGMFLVQNGQMTHEVVAVERQPDPDRKLDQLSRIDQAFIDWVAQNGTP